MKIAIDFVSTNLGSGTKTYNINFCKELEKTNTNHEFLIFLTKSYFDEIKAYKKNPKIKYKIKSNIFSKILLRLLWMQFIFPFELKIAGIQKLFSPMNFSPLFLKYFKIKNILALHSNLPWVYFNLMPGSIFRNFFTKKIMERSIKNCETLIVNSYFAKNEISDLLKIDKNKITTIYLGINNEYLFQNKKENFLNNFNYDQKYILSVLSCVKYHNIIKLLKAFKIYLNENNINIKFVLVMQILDKSYFKEINDYIRLNFKNNEIILLKNIKNEYLLNLYKNAQLYLFSSYCEVFGLTSLEAMSQGCPVLISSNSALIEINSHACVYFDPDNENEIKDKIYKILNDNNLKNELINKGLIHVKNFTWQTNIKKSLSVFEK